MSQYLRPNSGILLESLRHIGSRKDARRTIRNAQATARNLGSGLRPRRHASANEVGFGQPPDSSFRVSAEARPEGHISHSCERKVRNARTLTDLSFVVEETGASMRNALTLARFYYVKGGPNPGS